MQILGIEEATNYLLKHNTKKVVASLLGVSPYQVYLYSVGKTKSPQDKVVDAFYDKADILLDFYPSVEAYLEARRLRELAIPTSSD